MQSGRLNYAYRLSSARLAILRLRFARRWQRLLQRPLSSSRTSALRGLAGVAILVGMSGAAWLGYRVGQQAKVDVLVQTTDPVPAATNSQPAGQKILATPETEVPAFPFPVAAAASVVLAGSEPEGVERHAGAVRLAELASLRNSVGTLRAHVQVLEQETTGLEVELLDQQIAFAKAEEQWKEASVERRVVYNITNIPIGGSVSRERIESDAKQADGPTDQVDGGPVGRYPSQESSPPSGLPTDNQMRQEVFFGPAEDRFDDWGNPQ